VPKPPSSRPSCYYGMPDMYMQMGYFPFPAQPAAEPFARFAAIPHVAVMAAQCRYYLGQTEKMPIGEGTPCCGALVNPDDSGVQLHIQEYFITNCSSQPLEAQVWFGRTGAIPGAKTSAQISPGFVRLAGCPPAQGKILFSSAASETPPSSVAVSTQLLPPLTTSVFEKNGHWILDPGTAMMVFLHAADVRENGKNECLFAAAWWELPVFR